MTDRHLSICESVCIVVRGSRSPFHDRLRSTVANAPKLEPALEAVLRGARVDEHVISLFRVREILDREEFVNLHSSEEGMRQVVADPDAFGVNPEKGFVHAREMARIIIAWSIAKTQAETKQYVDNVAKAHGEPTTMLQVDWTTLLDHFKEKYGEHLREEATRQSQ